MNWFAPTKPHRVVVLGQAETRLRKRGGINLYAFVGNDPVNKWDILGTADSGWGNWDAIFHYFYGVGRPVTLTEINLDRLVSHATEDARDDWIKNVLKPEAEKITKGGSCQILKEFEVTKGAFATRSWVFWIGQVLLEPKAECEGIVICEGNEKCQWAYSCKVTFSMNDVFEHPTDFNNAEGGSWYDFDDFEPGDPFTVTHNWHTNDEGSGDF